MTIATGKGNDSIYVVGGNANLEIVYTGGNDVVDNGLTINNIRLDYSVAFTDVALNYNIAAHVLSLNILNHGSITLNNFYYVSYSPFRVNFGGLGYMDITGAYHTLRPDIPNPPTGGVWYGGMQDDHIVGIAGKAESLAGYAGNDILDGRDQDDGLVGGVGDDTLNGGTGNDALYGGVGNDTYIYNLGDGNDTITESGLDSGDKIILGAGIAAGDISFFMGTDSFGVYSSYIRVGAAGQISLTLSGNEVVDTLQLADGTVFNLTKGLPFTGTAGADTVYGTVYNDTLTGQTGDDNLNGGTGNDTYVFNIGDGYDTITDEGGLDTIKFGAGITVSNISVQIEDFANLVIYYGTSDKIILPNQIAAEVYTGIPDPTTKIETILFSDGSSIDISKGLPLSGTLGDDTISGTSFDDTINGKSGNDHLYGGDGNDTLDGG